MVKTAIAFSDWPFKNGEKVKLIKISKPFLDNGRWYLNAVFMSLEKKNTITLKRFFGDLHLLVVGAYYIDGIRQEMLDWQIKTLDIKSGDLFNKRVEPYLKKDRFNEAFDCYTFGIGFDDEYYVLPLLEIVRVVLAPDVFWLNQITMFDSIDTRILHEVDNNILKLNISSDIPLRYIKMDATIKHMAWIFTNMNIFKMLSQIYQNICDNKGVLFHFNFNDLAISFKYEKSDRIRYIKEIIAFRRKRILCEEIFVSHPGLIEHDENSRNEESKTQIVFESSSGIKELEMSCGALANSLVIVEGSADFEYVSVAKIHRVKKTRNINKNRILYLNIDDENGIMKRTTADFGGLRTIPQLEFFQSTTEKLEGDFSEIQAILLIMKKRREVIGVDFHIGYLKDHLSNRTICKLNDKKTLRKYLISRIKFSNGADVVMIEIQRDGKPISTMVCMSLIFRDWDQICHVILKNFVKKSGVWPIFDDIDLYDVECFRFKHTRVEILDKEKRIFEKIQSIIF